MITNPSNGVCRLLFRVGYYMSAQCICGSEIYACYGAKVICIRCRHERPTIRGVKYKIKLIAGVKIRDFIINVNKPL